MANTQRSPDHALPSLQQWLAATPGLWLKLEIAEQQWLIRYLWQGWSLAELAALDRNLRQKGIIRRLRTALARCLPPEAPGNEGLFCDK